jgi:hypothetical protein
MFGITCSTLLLSVTGSSLQDPQTITAPQSDNLETRKKSRRRKCDACSQPTTQEIYIPLIDLPEARGGGELVFNSRSPEAVDVTPVFYRRNGTMVRGNPVRIESTEIRYVNIRELMPAPYRHEGDWGGLSLTYNGFNREMWSQFRFLEVNGGGNVDEFFTVKEESRSDLLEAVWWMPRQSEAIIALGNITDTDTSATVYFNDGRTRTVKLKPHETEVIRQNDQGNDAAASVRIEVTGAAGSIVPTGIITARDGSFNSVIRFYNPKGARQPHLFANGLRIADVTAHMILRNTSAASVTVQPEFIPVSGRFTGDTLVLPQTNLRPNEVIELDLSALRAMATNNRALETVSVEIRNSGPAGSVIGSIYGINNRTGTSYDVPLRDSGPARSMTGSYPWKISDDFSTVVYVTNISDQEAQFITQINYPGGNLVFEPRKVGPGETAVFDLKKIRDEGSKDLAGKQLPANATQGQFKWAVRGMTNGKLVLIGRAEMVSSSQHISTSYSCNDPCPPYYGGDINPFPPPVVINGQATTAIWETAYYDTGYVVGPYSTWATWTNLYDPVVTFEPSNGHSITITGVETGGTTLHGFIAMQQDYGWDGLNCYEYGYYEEYADAPVEVEPPRVAKIQYQASSGFVDVSGTLFVLKGTSVTFKAVPDPANGQWPAGKPVWSGTSGASGTGETTSVTFDTNSSSTSDFKTVVATSGNAITANVVVFELTPQLTPNDNFTGRSLERFGITERLTLGFTVTPSGVTAAQAGGLQWQQINGAGSLEDAGTDGTATYDVASTPGSAALKLKILDGPSKDSGPSKNITVVAPSDGFVLKQPLSGIKHNQNWWSCGFLGDIYVLPNDVSFFGVAFKEDDVGAAASGWLSFLNGTGHCVNGTCPQATIFNGNSNGLGARVNAEDQIFSGSYRSLERGPYATGTVTWPIPWKWGVTGGTWQALVTANQTATSTSTGRCTIQKRGSNTYARELGDPTEDW